MSTLGVIIMNRKTAMKKFYDNTVNDFAAKTFEKFCLYNH